MNVSRNARSQCGSEPVDPPIVRARLRVSAVACSSRESSAAKSCPKHRIPEPFSHWGHGNAMPAMAPSAVARP
jgi:hypothetical protein